MYELINRRELAAYFKLLAPGYVEHLTTGDMSLEQIKQLDAIMFAAFPDVTSTIEDMVAEEDKVAFRVTHRGTHKGEFMGIPPTGNKIEMTNTFIIKIATGKVAEGWATIDELRLMQQLGVIPKQ
jgi:steroid delta-isomerase-like uncharacterized protein